jgi:hypothetical protein
LIIAKAAVNFSWLVKFLLIPIGGYFNRGN